MIPWTGGLLPRIPLALLVGDVNVYAYVGNQPVNWVDPSGNAGLFNIPREAWNIPGLANKFNGQTHAFKNLKKMGLRGRWQQLG